MIVRSLVSLCILLCVLVAAQLARPVQLDSLVVNAHGVVEEIAHSEDNSAFEVGDRILAINGRPLEDSTSIASYVLPWDAHADIRSASLGRAERETLEDSALDGDLPEILAPVFYVLEIDGQKALGASASTVAKALQDQGNVDILAVPTQDVEDRHIALQRGWPPLFSLLAVGIAILALLILWAGAPLLGVTLGFFAAGAALWLTVAYPAAQLVGLLVLCIGVATGAWFFLRNLGGRDARPGQRALRHEGEETDANLLIALEQAEERVGSRLYVVVGSSSQAVELSRDYERIVVEEAETVLTSTLSMLATEGGVFPRVDVGEDVRDPWGDPLQDLDTTVQIAAAVPVPGYGQTQDRWAFVIARTWDSVSSQELLQNIAEIAEIWRETGVRESISMHATHGLLQIVRTQPSQADPAPKTSDVSATLAPDMPLHTHLDNVSEGVGVPRVVSRTDLEARGKGHGSTTSQKPATPPDAARGVVSGEHPRTPPKPSASDALIQGAEGIGVPRTVRREDLAREQKKVVQAPAPSPPPSKAEATQTGLRAWSGHLERRMDAAYPVDDPRCYRTADWRRVAPLLSDEAPALIYGEAGVGKAFAARAVHERSRRADRPIAVIDCAELSEAEVELELFGLRDEPGVLAGISGGALILISPALLSVAMLDAIVAQLRTHDVRLFVLVRQQSPTLVFTSDALEDWMDTHIGERRVHLPPLRERPQDVLAAATWFLEYFSLRYAGGQARSFSAAAKRWLKDEAFPANYWDVAACVRRAVLCTDADVISREALAGTAQARDGDARAQDAEQERRRLVSVLHRTEGNKAEAARILGLTSDALLRRLKRHGLI